MGLNKMVYISFPQLVILLHVMKIAFQALRDLPNKILKLKINLLSTFLTNRDNEQLIFLSAYLDHVPYKNNYLCYYDN